MLFFCCFFVFLSPRDLKAAFLEVASFLDARGERMYEEIPIVSLLRGALGVRTTSARNNLMSCLASVEKRLLLVGGAGE